ncbi:BrnT family toxin [Sphingomonas glacialis]|uniref:BrnT family toxin n=1 Tax=Sphingomonas glacialis TaxID=658225 RepID=UPI001672D432|nr:BrnT family toxin [Sphingomonas glacialis]
MFDGPQFTLEDIRFPYPERRYATFGLIEDRLIVLVWAEAEERRRIISMRKANDRPVTKSRSRLA